MSLPFSLDEVRKVTFFKRDQITVDLICCDIEVDTPEGFVTWFNHEYDESWQLWIEQLGTLPEFDSDWFSRVSQPAFAPSVSVAYERPIA